jgi:hypothetical protein
MATPLPRSAALLISLYVDEAGGAGWYAQLRSFDDPTSAESTVQRVAAEHQLVEAVRRWLGAALGGHAAPPPGQGAAGAP